MILFLPVFLVILTMNTILVDTKKCPAVRPMRNFDFRRYQGKWYEVQRYSSGPMKSRCTSAEYWLNMDGSLNVVETFILISKKRTVKVNGLWIPNPSNPADVTLRYKQKEGEWKCMVVDTDYRTYALVYSCETSSVVQNEFAWIMSRKPALDNDVIAELKDKLRAYGSRVKNFKRTEQDNCDKKT